MTEPPLEITLDPVFRAPATAARLGLVTFTAGTASPDLDAALDALTARVRTTPLAEIAPIQATRRAYKALGKDPSRYRPASEALHRRIAKGEPAPRLHPLVDLNTLVSLETGYAAGIYDRRHLAPPLRFRVGTAGETYPAIGGQAAFNLENLPLLADSHGPFGSPTRDGERARVAPATTAALLVLFDFGDGDLEAALAMAKEAAERYTGAADAVAWTVT
jgi:DNA/RNA-binding domain of Phe-tRNA-synthetase-like protein